MTYVNLPLLLEATVLNNVKNHNNLLIVDLSAEHVYQQSHIPGAIHLDPKKLLSGEKPAIGKLPSKEILTEVFSQLGLLPHHHVIAYDDEGGGWAGRFLWTLDMIGHSRFSYLNGGIRAWFCEGFPVETNITIPVKSNYVVNDINTKQLATVDSILSSLGKDNFAVWDARSIEEFTGSKAFALNGGHIPGAIWYEWFDLMDKANNLKLLPLEQIQQQLNQLKLTKEKSIVTHCHSHHRSGLTWLVGKILGYPNIKAYPGSWSEWGNLPNMPIEKI